MSADQPAMRTQPRASTHDLLAEALRTSGYKREPAILTGPKPAMAVPNQAVPKQAPPADAPMTGSLQLAATAANYSPELVQAILARPLDDPEPRTTPLDDHALPRLPHQPAAIDLEQRCAMADKSIDEQVQRILASRKAMSEMDARAPLGAGEMAALVEGVPFKAEGRKPATSPPAPAVEASTWRRIWRMVTPVRSRRARGAR